MRSHCCRYLKQAASQPHVGLSDRRSRCGKIAFVGVCRGSPAPINDFTREAITCTNLSSGPSL